MGASKLVIGLRYLALFTAILAWLVIGLGAYTRLVDAGLGCPDWPGCYGHFIISSAFNSSPNSAKAWTEMIHRYFAGLLGILVIVNVGLATLISTRFGIQFLIIGMILFGLLIYQATLGMLTVTLKLLPLIVTQHLLGGMAILGLLWLLYLKTRDLQYTQPLQVLPHLKSKLDPIKPWALLGLILVGGQIALGAWTSTHYAAISCPDFPFCQAEPWRFNFYDAFNVLAPVSLVNKTAQMTIHMTHRFGALIITCYLLCLIIRIYQKNTQPIKIIKNIILILLAILLIQITLGILNILLSLPLWIAVAHNLCAGLLLISMISLYHTLKASTS